MPLSGVKSFGQCEWNEEDGAVEFGAGGETERNRKGSGWGQQRWSWGHPAADRELRAKLTMKGLDCLVQLHWGETFQSVTLTQLYSFWSPDMQEVLDQDCLSESLQCSSSLPPTPSTSHQSRILGLQGSECLRSYGVQLHIVHRCPFRPRTGNCSVNKHSRLSKSSLHRWEKLGSRRETWICSGSQSEIYGSFQVSPYPPASFLQTSTQHWPIPGLYEEFVREKVYSQDAQNRSPNRFFKSSKKKIVTEMFRVREVPEQGT